MSTTPIADYALLSDRHSAALVSGTGPSTGCASPASTAHPSSVGSSATMPATGRSGPRRPRRSPAAIWTEQWCWKPPSVRPRVRSRSPTPWPWARATGDTSSARMRRIFCLRGATCIDGDVDLVMEYVLRPEYGRIHPRLLPSKVGSAASWGTDELVLSSPIPLTLDKSAASGRVPPPPRRDSKLRPASCEAG